MAKKIRRPNTAKVVYRIYKNKNGLILELKDQYDGERSFPEFESVEDAIDAMEKCQPSLDAEFVILPILIVREKYDGYS